MTLQSLPLEMRFWPPTDLFVMNNQRQLVFARLVDLSYTNIAAPAFIGLNRVIFSLLPQSEDLEHLADSKYERMVNRF